MIPGGDSMREAGYLSTEAFNVEPFYLDTFRTTLELFQRTNRLAMRVLSVVPQEAQPTFDGARMFVATALLAIVIRRCEAAVLLAYRGLSFEADTLSRSGVEATIILGSYLSNPDRLLTDLDNAEVQTKLAAANSMLDQHKKKPFLAGDDFETLTSIARELASMPAGRLYLQTHAGYADMENLYTYVYRRLSFGASHVTSTLLVAHTTWDDSFRQVEFGPDEDASRPCADATVVLINAVVAVMERFNINGFADETKQLRDEVARLKPVGGIVG